MPLSDLLSWVQQSRRRGVVIVRRDGYEWHLSVDGDTVTRYSGPELHDDLGQVVVTSGIVSEEVLSQAHRVAREEGCSLRAALLQSGLLSAERLQSCLAELATESIYDLFIDLPGEFVFTEVRGDADNATGDAATASADFDIGADIDSDLDDEDDDDLSLTLTVNMLLMEGARRQDEWQHIREQYGDGDVNIEVDQDLLPPTDELSIRERRILSKLTAGCSIGDICLELRAPIPSVLRTLNGFAQNGSVNLQPRIGNGASEHSDKRLEELRVQAKVMREARQFDESLALLSAAIRMSPTESSLRQTYEETLAEQVQELYQSLPPVREARVVADAERLASMRLSPEERFLLQRIGSGVDVGSLVMMSAVNERDTLRSLQKFLHSGVIELN